MCTVAILGAGCAGTLLATELRRRRFAGRVELFDVRTDFTREQRWCFWRTRREGGLGLPISAEWPAWQVADGHRTICRAAPSYIYSHVHAPEFFRRFHGRLAEDLQVGFHLGHRVLAVRKRRGGVYCVRTSSGESFADVVIDARHEGTPAYQCAIAHAPDLLWQTFRGRVVESGAACFDPTTAVLMDFRVPVAGAGLTFAYVLPFNKTRALVEVVLLGRARPTAPKLDAILDAYLEERFGGSGDTIAVEDGALPMTSRPFATPAADGTISLGVGGGMARPSSGYAFVNMVRAAERTAAALCAGRPLRQPRFAWKYRGLDALFLRLLGVDPGAAQRAFMAMFAGIEPDRLIRFLTETSSWRDDLALGLALPKAAFLRTLLPLPFSRARKSFRTEAVASQAENLEDLKATKLEEAFDTKSE